MKDFDRIIGQMHGLPDTVHTKPATVQTLPMLGIGVAVACIVQTYRQRDDETGRSSDTIFLTHISDETVRLVIPPAVADAIARQRDALGAKNRSKAGKARAEADKAAGVVPGFMRGKGKKK